MLFVAISGWIVAALLFALSPYYAHRLRRALLEWEFVRTPGKLEAEVEEETSFDVATFDLATFTESIRKEREEMFALSGAELLASIRRHASRGQNVFTIYDNDLKVEIATKLGFKVTSNGGQEFEIDLKQFLEPTVEEQLNEALRDLSDE